MLSPQTVDEISMDIQAFLKKKRTASEDIIRLRFSIEERLLRIYENLGEVEVYIEMGSTIGKPAIRISYGGEKFDPDDTAEDDWASQILSNMGQAPSYGYMGKRNTLLYTLPGKRIKSEIQILAAVILAVIFGASKAVLPEGFIVGLEDFVLDPVNTVFINLLNTFAGIMIFLSVIVAICGMGSTSEFNKMGGYMMSRFIGLTFVGSAFAILVGFFFFNFRSGLVITKAAVQEIVDLIISVVPENPVSPFMENNTLQIIMMAIITGFIMLGLGSRVDQVRIVINQINRVILDVLELICKLIPAYIFTSLAIMFFDSGFSVFVELWKPILICLFLTAVFGYYKIMRVATRYKVGFGKLVTKIAPGVLVGFTTCSSSAAFTHVLDANDNRLGIAPEYSRLGVPLGNILYSPAIAISFVVMVYHLASISDVPVGLLWFVVCWIVCSVLAIAVPPLAGGTLVCLGLMLTSMGIPMSAMALASTLSIVYDFITTPALIASGHMELILQSDHLGILNKEMLKK